MSYVMRWYSILSVITVVVLSMAYYVCVSLDSNRHYNTDDLAECLL